VERLDPSRIAAQVVSGIGFLGAGAILARGEIVKGLTTAASIWTPDRAKSNVTRGAQTDRKSFMDGSICQEAKQSNGVNYFKNLQQPDRKNLCFPEHRAWLRRHKSNHGWNRTRSGSRTRRGGHLVEFASTRLR